MPEAQLDRFLMKIRMGYPTKEQEVEILRRAENGAPIEKIQAVLSVEQLIELQELVLGVYVEDSVKNYMVELASQTRQDSYVYLGVSPRASIALMKASQAYAFMKGRSYVTPDDVQYLVPFVFSHRLMLKPDARYDGVTAEEIIERIIAKVPVPTKRFAEQ